MKNDQPKLPQMYRQPMAHKLRQRNSAPQAAAGMWWPADLWSALSPAPAPAPSPSRIRRSSAALTAGTCAGSSRNHGKNATHHTTPISPAVQKAKRQDDNSLSGGRGARNSRNSAESKQRSRKPKISGENAPPQRARSHNRPPARARERAGSQLDWTRAMLGYDP